MARCELHQAQHAEVKAREVAQYDAQRGSPAERGYDTEWKALAAQFLSANPTCRCGKRAVLVHHLRSVRQAPALRLAWFNLRSVCASCHQREHARMKAEPSHLHRA